MLGIQGPIHSHSHFRKGSLTSLSSLALPSPLYFPSPSEKDKDFNLTAVSMEMGRDGVDCIMDIVHAIQAKILTYVL